jgi:DNA-directed RNA polymerase specialized sigma24 family protein
MKEYEELEKDMEATKEEHSLHQRLVTRNDRTAFEELVNLVYTRLVNDIIGCAGSRVDPHIVEEAVGQALLNYRDRPDRYNLQTHSLYSYLRMIAYRDFLDAQRKETRHGINQLSLSDLTVADELNIIEEAEDVVSIQSAKDLWMLIEPTFRNDRDKKLALLVINRARPFELYAKLLQIEHLPKAEQQKLVKREKDRISKHLRRLGENFHE